MLSLIEILAAQDDLITRCQALTVMSEAELRRLIRTSWTVVAPGVYLASRADPTFAQRLRAAVLHAGPESQLADQTALAVYGVPYLPTDSFVRILVPEPVQRVSCGFIKISRTTRMPQPAFVNGLPVVPAHRALTDFVARFQSRRDSLAVAAAVVQRKMISATQFRQEIAEGPARGRSRLRWMLEQLEAGVRSAPEYDVRALVLACPGLAEPLWNPLLRLPTGRLVSPDGFWIDSATASEVDGRDQHSADIAGPDAFDQTYAKRVWMEAAGIDVVSFTGRQPRTASQLVISRIVDAVTRNAGRGLPPGVEIVRPAPPPW